MGGSPDFIRATTEEKYHSPHFYPGDYEETPTHFNAQGYGANVDKDVVIYHRWGTGNGGQLERFIIVINASDYDQ